MASYVLSHAVMSLQTPGSVPLAKRREDEVSVGSTPLAKQPSNQASDYASSPVKTKTVTGKFTKPKLKILLWQCTSYKNLKWTPCSRDGNRVVKDLLSETAMTWTSLLISALLPLFLYLRILSFISGKTTFLLYLTVFLCNEIMLLCCYITHYSLLTPEWTHFLRGHRISRHVLLCFPPLVVLLWALDAQNRWVAWLCGAFLYASFPLSGTPLFRTNTFSVCAHTHNFTE